MNKTLLISKNIREKDLRLDYYIIQEKYIDILNNISTTVYGVEVLQTTGGDEDSVKKRAIHNITHNKEIMSEFIHFLSDNEVTPFQLYDIVAEKVDEDYFLEKLA